MFYGSIGLCKYLHKITLKNFCLFLAVLGLHCCLGFSLVVVNGGSFLVAGHEPLIAVDFLAAEHRF